jgi:hypothetical protein
MYATPWARARASFGEVEAEAGLTWAGSDGLTQKPYH